MKKLILSMAFIISLLEAHSQSWSVNGNAGTTPSNFIGTTDGEDFRIKTSNSTRLTVNSAGYTGVGITPESNSKLYSSITVSTLVALDQVYAASRGRANGSGVRSNGY